ncbi:aquaporin-like protein [Phanerochaete sordida]|uniref:Aquaporin-like protein n=1 Tax=Phanerochaete sordida TaxID=48140 RepID=A0A9P3GMG4_9APHY|nr:aquaporin-like protein [Phanerochaete sordida]
MTMHQLPRRDVVHLADVHTRPRVFSVWERYRHRQAHWFVECIAETMGVFFYVYAGVGSTAGFVIGNLSNESISSVLQIGFAYAFGILFALITCGSTSGGHFNPAVTICQVIFRGFPIKKACRYIVFQILGAFLAGLLVYVQWRVNIRATEAVLHTEGKWDAVMFTPQGLAGIFALYAPAGSNLGQVLLNEFVCDFLIGLVIWSCMDPTNFLVPPSAGPWIVSFSYAMCIWGYSPVGLSTNTARDLGTRLAVMAIWGTPAAGGSYAAIAALTNIPATILAACFHEFILADSSRVITPEHVNVMVGHLAHAEHSGIGSPLLASASEKQAQPASPSPSYKPSYSTHDHEKGQVETIERV